MDFPLGSEVMARFMELGINDEIHAAPMFSGKPFIRAWADFVSGEAVVIVSDKPHAVILINPMKSHGGKWKWILAYWFNRVE